MAEQSAIIFRCAECNTVALGTTNRPRTCNMCHHFATAHKSDARTHACPINADGEVIVCPGWAQCPTAHRYVYFTYDSLFSAKHASEIKRAKSEAKKSNSLISHSLAAEFKELKTPEEKRELVNATLQKLRGISQPKDKVLNLFSLLTI